MSDDVTVDQLTELIEANPMAEETTENTETTEETTSQETTETKTEETKSNGKDKETETTSDVWRDSIEDADLRKVADRIASPTAAVQIIADLRKRDSQIRIPGKDASEKDVAAYHKAIGVPGKADGYEFAVPEGHELTDNDKAFQAWAGETFHAQDITAEQAKGLAAAWNEYAAGIQQAQIDTDKAYAAETEAALKKEWPGKEFDINRQFADTATKKLFGGDIDEVRNIETKDGRFILDHPAFLRVFAQYGREMAEGRAGDVMTDGDRDGVQNEIDDLQKKIDKAKADGDNEKANRLYQKQLALDATIVGTRPVVGAEGRTA